MKPRQGHPPRASSMYYAVLLACVARLAGAAPSAPAADAAGTPATAPATARTDAADQADGMQSVVVTGTAKGRTKLSAPFAISTFSEAQLQRDASGSTVDMLKRVPGMSVEASGGQGGGQNIYVRGLPAGGWFYVQLQHDGLTMFDEPQESFFNIDTLYRLDLMTERVEVVRGGTSPIFANNAPGATVNIIGRKGSDAPEGTLRATIGSHGLTRYDGYVSGPVNDRLSYAVGGFYRRDKGWREPGYTADQGGQLTAAATLKLDGGHLDVEAKVLNDRTAFYTAIPLFDPRTPSLSLNGQLDAGTGTLNSSDFRHYRVRTVDNGVAGSVDRDLADGIHTDLKQFSVNVEQQLGDGWSVANRFGAVHADVSYDAVFSGASPQDANGYLAGKLAAARAGFGASVNRLGYVLANQRGASGQRVAFDPAGLGGLVLESQLNAVDTGLKTITDDLRLGKKIDTPLLGKHELTAGLYYSHFDFTQRRMPNVILTTVSSQAKALDVLAYDQGGAVVGAVTEDGFVRYGNGAAAGHATGTYVSPYLADAWQVLPRLTLDAGLRRTIFTDRGANAGTVTQNQQDPGTLADNNVGGLSGATTAKRETLGGNSWTLGAAYKPADAQQLFARLTKAVRFPRLQNVYLLQTTPVTDIRQAEAGWRVAGPLSFSAIGFYSHFNRLSLNGLVLNQATGNLETLPLIGETETKGLELEANWRASPRFSVNGSLTLQQPKTKRLANPATGSSGAAYDGKQLTQIPKLLASVQPIWNLDIAGQFVELSATASRIGKRYVDYANSTALPAYTTVDLGARIPVGAWEWQLSVKNAGNSTGLTEGNPRTDSLTGQGSATAIYGRPVFARQYQASLAYRW